MLLWILFVVVILVVLYVYICSDKPAPIVIDGSHVIVTGGSSGIGLAVAKELAQKGAHVTIIARNVQKLKEAQKEIENCRLNENQRILQYSASVTDYDALSEAVADAVAVNGKIDVLIASAGDTSPLRFEDVPADTQKRITDVNVVGVIFSTRAVIPYMKERQQGRIIFVSSILGLFGFPGYSGYCASKFAVRGFAESLGLEYNRDNIYFSISFPQNVDTPMFEEEEKYKPEEVKALEEGTDVATAEQISGSIVNSLTNYSFFITFGFEPTFTSLSAGGFSPGSFTELMGQLFLGPILRLVSLFYIKLWRNTLKKFQH
eukprot:TRINITY_DN3369_c0_g1_i1.p1 TRINITY_DN3369_c0_g1~~TRINITY_DN3369_c0_g1_i1.p1  ORF type:complete len:318 (+),score=73.19 TRINITY_DN3369_c0_g1_i1:182-1135(+)